MVSEFPSNSHRSKEVGAKEPVEPKKQEDKKKIDKVVQSDVVRRKKPLGKRFKEIFVGGDARGVWAFVALDVMVPAAKDMFADAVSQGVERMIYGEARSTGRRTGRKPNEPYISYNRYSSNGPGRRRPGHSEERPREVMSRRARATHDFDEIILATRVEADEVLDRLYDLVSKYESATVADLYDLVGVSGSYTDDKWGWVDLRGAGIARVRNGYLLDLPKPEPLD